MEISVLQMILIGITSGICMMGWLLGVYTATPLVYAFFTGLVLKDVKTALIIGSSAQILWLGFGMGTGGVRPPDPIAPGVLGTIIGVVQHHGKSGLMSISEASSIVAITFAFGILVQFLTTFLLTAMSPVAKWSKNSVENGKFGRFKIYSWLTIIVVLFIGFAIGVASAKGGVGLAHAMEKFPEWTKTSLKVVGGLMPALGFALIMNVMLKKEYIAYIFIGYVLMLIVMAISSQMKLHYSLMLLAVAALGIALVVVGIEQKILKIKNGKGIKSKREAIDGGI